MLPRILLILLLASTAAAQHAVEPAVIIDDAPFLESLVRAGTDGDGYLVTWTDARGVRGSRFDGDGRLLDPISLGLAPGPSDLRDEYKVAVRSIAGAGGEWLIVQANGEVRRLRRDGVVELLGLTMPSPSVASNRRGFVIWSAAAAATFTDGVVRHAPAAALPKSISSVAAGDGLYALLGRDGTRLTVNFLRDDATTLFDAPRALADTDGGDGYTLVGARVFREGNAFRAVWMTATARREDAYSWRLVSAAFDASGAAISPVVRIWSGTTRSASYETFKAIDVVQMGPADALIRWTTAPHPESVMRWSCRSRRGLSDGVSTASAALASNGRTLLRANYEQRPDRTETSWDLQVRIAAVRCDLSPLMAVHAVFPNRSAEQQIAPLVAVGNESAAVAWMSERGSGGQRRLQAARVTREGMPIERFKSVDAEDPRHHQFLHGIAGDGAGFAAVWSEGSWGEQPRLFRAMTLVPVGAHEVPIPIAIASKDRLSATGWEAPPSIAWNGREYLIAWAEEHRVHLARMSRDGLLLSSAAVTEPLPSVTPGDVRIASSGSKSMVVWTDISLVCPIQPVGCGRRLGVRALRVDRDAGVLDPKPLTLSDSGELPYVAWNAPYWFVLWFHGHQYAGRRITGDGQLLDPTRHNLGVTPYLTALVPAGSGVAAATWTGGMYLFDRELSPRGRIDFPSDAAAIHPAPVTEGTLLVAYQRRVAESPYGGVYRVFAESRALPFTR